MEQTIEDGRKKGYVETLFGRKRWIPDLKSQKFLLRSGAERIAQNTPIQGTAADVIKLAMIAVDRGVKAKGLSARLVLQVHDELILECPQEEGAMVAEIVAEEMAQVAKLRVPLVADTHIGTSWGEAH